MIILGRNRRKQLISQFPHLLPSGSFIYIHQRQDAAIIDSVRFSAGRLLVIGQNGRLFEYTLHHMRWLQIRSGLLSFRYNGYRISLVPGHLVKVKSRR